MQDLRTSETSKVIALLALERGVLTPDAALALIDGASSEADLVAKLALELTDAGLMREIANEFGLRFIDLYGPNEQLTVSKGLLEEVDGSLLNHYRVLPLKDAAGNTVVALSNPIDVDARELVKKHFPDAEIVLADSGEIASKLKVVGSPVRASAPKQQRRTEMPVIEIGQRSDVENLVDQVLEIAISYGASDLHFDRTESGGLTLRMRVDGVLREQPFPAEGREREVVGSLLAKAQLDPTNMLSPQDGGFSFGTSSGRKIDTRLAMLPHVNGPSVVIRLLDPANINRKLEDMGFTPAQLEVLQGSAGVGGSQGLVIVSGPTGSGKTTTLYSLIKRVAGPGVKTITVEDPVEYHLDWVNQTQVTRAGEKALTFARALRSILRSDPDNVLVGEIRDTETAQMALDAAITGHLVMSTIHTRTAAGIYGRLIEMGTPAYLVADALTVGVAQRLARALHSCTETRPTTDHEAAAFAEAGLVAPAELAQAIGCGGCGDGYRGRVGIAEVLQPSQAVRQMVLRQASVDEIEAQARDEGFESMLDIGLQHAVNGRTTVAEVLRVIGN